MLMPHIDVRFNFDTDEENGYTHYNLVSAERVDTDIPRDAMLSVGETLAQSDHWNVGGVGATLSAMVDDNSEAKIVKDYW